MISGQLWDDCNATVGVDKIYQRFNAARFVMEVFVYNFHFI